MVGNSKGFCIATILVMVILVFTDIANAEGDLINSNYINKETISRKREKGRISRKSKKDGVHEEDILKAKEGKEVYEVLNETFLLDKPNEEGKSIEELKSEEIIYLINSHEGYGLFITKDSNKGFVKLDELEKESEELINITTGNSKVTKDITNEDGLDYELIKGDNVLVKDYDKESKEYIIIDEFGNEFILPSEFIGLKGNPAAASRGRKNIYKKGKSSIEKPELGFLDFLLFDIEEFLD